MVTFARLRYIIVTAFLAVPVSHGPVFAQSTMDEMLAELKTADETRAAHIVREVERQWELSGSTSIDMLLRRGREAMEEEDWRLAIEHFTAVTDHAPDFAEGYQARATAFYRSGRFGPAIDDLGQALVLNPQNWNALYGLGVLFQELGEHARAEMAYRAALELHPHHENATEALKTMKKLGIGHTL